MLFGSVKKSENSDSNFRIADQFVKLTHIINVFQILFIDLKHLYQMWLWVKACFSIVIIYELVLHEKVVRTICYLMFRLCYQAKPYTFSQMHTFIRLFSFLSLTPNGCCCLFWPYIIGCWHACFESATSIHSSSVTISTHLINFPFIWLSKSSVCECTCISNAHFGRAFNGSGTAAVIDSGGDDDGDDDGFDGGEISLLFNLLLLLLMLLTADCLPNHHCRSGSR